MPGLLGEGGCPETMPWEGCGAGDDTELDSPAFWEKGAVRRRGFLSLVSTSAPAAVLGPAFYEKGAVRRRSRGLPAVHGSRAYT